MSFAHKVYRVVQTIPPGEFMTYKQVATFAGNAKAYRAVGQILKRNPDNTKIPCHRVIRSDLQLSGYAFGGKDVQKKKLESEGLIFKAYTVVEKEPMQKPKRQKK